VLRDFRPLWGSMEITSYEPLHLIDIQHECPGIPTDLLIPRSESWMGLDVVAYVAIQRGRLARVRAVHLHPTQLSTLVTTMVREAGLEIHTWDVNDDKSLQAVQEHQISRVCTDQLEQLLKYRKSLDRAFNSRSENENFQSSPDRE
jgi:glycerophosphoryl diester phosphodiesterase